MMRFLLGVFTKNLHNIFLSDFSWKMLISLFNGHLYHLYKHRLQLEVHLSKNKIRKRKDYQKYNFCLDTINTPFNVPTDALVDHLFGISLQQSHASQQNNKSSRLKSSTQINREREQREQQTVYPLAKTHQQNLSESYSHSPKSLTPTSISPLNALQRLVEIEHILLNSESDLEAYRQLLPILADTCNASRICVHECGNQSENIYELKIVSSWNILTANPELTNFEETLKYYHLEPNCLNTLIAGKKYLIPVSNLPIPLQEKLQANGVKEILLLPICLQNRWMATIILEINGLETTWEAISIFLQVAASAVTLAYQRWDATNSLENLMLESQVIEQNANLEREIAWREAIQTELEKSLSLQQATLESTADGIMVVDNQGQITGFNQKFLQMWNLSESVMTAGKTMTALKTALSQLDFPKHYLETLRELSHQPDAQIYDSITFKDGRVFERYTQPQYINGKIVGRVWSFRDVTAHKQAEARIRHQALHDLLTNLPNRVLFNERLAQALETARLHNQSLAVCFLDLDRFKTINDTLGHPIGDKLLQTVARRLTSCLGEEDTIARWGGDEFTIILPNIRDSSTVAKVQERILAALKPGFDIDNHHLHIGASIGVALYPLHGRDGDTLIQNADVALYRAKSQGCNKYQFYYSAINSQASELLILENHLHYALERNEFTIYYQPQVNISTGEITKMEALLRWRHPTLGVISPSKFIPIAEETGLIISIGEWVMRSACHQNKIWQDMFNLPSLSVAVNLSTCQFQQPNLTTLIAKILDEAKLAPHNLELEITESLAMQNVDRTQGILGELHKMGILLSIDDFGTGYCSLSYLKNFPLNTLKIDRSFIQDISTNSHDLAITTAIIALAHGLNLAVVAEGVETAEQLNCLRLLECELMQGYLFSKALSVADATQLLAQTKSQKFNPNYLVA